MAATCELELVRTDEGLEALRTEWEALHAASEQRNPFLSFAWTQTCRKYECPHSELFVLIAREAGQLVGVAPLRLDQQAGFRVLRFVGDGRSDYLGFLTPSGRKDLQGVLLAALRNRRDDWDLAVLRQLTEPYSSLAHAVAPKGVLAHGVVGTVAPHLAYDGEWEALMQAGPGWLRRMRKAARKWVKDGGSVAQIPGVDAARYVDQVAEVEARSWKGEQGVARFQPGPGQELLRQALQTLAPLGQMELWLAWKEDRPAAYNVNFRTPHAVWVYQGAYVHDYAKYSPGGILDFLSFERAWQDGVREYDFLCGDEPYKAERTTAQRTVRYLALHPATVRGHLAYRLLIAPRWGLKDYAPARAAHQCWTRWRSRARSRAVASTPRKSVVTAVAADRTAAGVNPLL